MRTLISIVTVAFPCLGLIAKAVAAPVAWKPCSLNGVQGKAECTTISVAEDRAKPNGRRIALRVVRLLPLSQRVASRSGARAAGWAWTKRCNPRQVLWR